jgi:RNA exonuclease 1
VECVSTGKNRDDRAICSVGIVDENCEILFNKIVKPGVPVTDYLTAITGFTEDSLINGEKEEAVLQEIHSILTENVVLVGQSPENDIKWLKVGHKHTPPTHQIIFLVLNS